MKLLKNAWRSCFEISLIYVTPFTLFFCANQASAQRVQWQTWIPLTMKWLQLERLKMNIESDVVKANIVVKAIGCDESLLASFFAFACFVLNLDLLCIRGTWLCLQYILLVCCNTARIRKYCWWLVKNSAKMSHCFVSSWSWQLAYTESKWLGKFVNWFWLESARIRVSNWRDLQNSKPMVFNLFHAATHFATQFNLTTPFRKYSVRHMHGANFHFRDPRLFWIGGPAWRFATTGVVQISTTRARYIHWISCSNSWTYYVTLNSLDIRHQSRVSRPQTRNSGPHCHMGPEIQSSNPQIKICNTRNQRRFCQSVSFSVL